MSAPDLPLYQAFRQVRACRIGAIERVNNVMAVRADTGVKSFDDLKSREIALGASGPGSPTSLLPSLLRWMAPVKLKTVEGYPGISQMFAAIERSGARYDSLPVITCASMSASVISVMTLGQI